MSSERESCLVTCNALISEVLEDLLQSRLCYTVFLNSKPSLFVLELTKEPSDCLLFLGDAHFKELAALLQDFYLLEVASQESQDSKAVCLRLKELKQVCEANCIIGIKFRLKQ